MSPTPRRLRQRPAGQPGALRLGALGAAAAALLTVPLVAPAGATAATYTVSVGGDASPGTHPVSTTSAGSVLLSARNSAGTIINYSCTRIDGTGQVTTGPSVNPVASIDTTAWSGCTMAGGALRILSAGWSWVADGAAGTGDDTVTGRLENVELTISAAANPDVCRFTVTGSMRASLDEATQHLRVAETGHTGRLTLSGVRGCMGRVQDGNPFNVAFTWDVASPNGLVGIG